jgi:transcriptional regulator with XRE-family HTH domain
VPAKRQSLLLREVGARIRKARHKKGLSQKQLAHAANMDRSYVSGLERGEFNISLLALAAIARVLGVPLRALVSAD